MKILIVILLISIQGLTNPVSTWQNAAYGSLLEYFSSSNRIIQSLKWSNLSIVDKQNQEYLVEADVIAKNKTNQEIKTYHCGVFAKKLNNENWQVKLTTCETFSDQSR